METNLGLVAGSHNNNEFIIIRQDGDFGVSSNKSLFIIIISCMYIYLSDIIVVYMIVEERDGREQW